MDLKSTLHLPDPEFTIPMKADLAQREPGIQANWDAASIYHEIQKSRAGRKPFVLHDGPPYTNSPIHLGTALNKILKDFVVKSRTMMGHLAPYVPGYDNHGLPIELAVLASWAEEVKKDPVRLAELGFDSKPSDAALTARLRKDLAELRTRCRSHAQRYIEVQTQQFKRLGVFGLWEKPYTTMAYEYEAEIVRTFKRLVMANQVYRGLRPVLWSPTSQTALADTEILYKDHTSKAIYVAFPLSEDPKGILTQYGDVSAVIWTTTPWTIPANLACAFHPDLNYAVVQTSRGLLLMYEGLVERVMAEFGVSGHSVLGRIQGMDLEGIEFKHPIYDRHSTAVLADYVTTEDGTGIVHTAPGHGREDFMTGLKYNLPILCPVDERGVLTEEAGEFAGTHYKQCDTVVVNRLEELGALLHVSDYFHSYPHAERDGQPVIYRATQQWFVSIDDNTLRERILEAVHQRIEWHPANSVGRIGSMIAGRPDWCISRQRPWGVGIPIFYGRESGRPVLDPQAIEYAAKLVEQEGSDAWFLREANEILPAGYKHPDTGETEFTKEVDVFDVWFDSGATHLCVLEGNVEPEWKAELPVDLYFEGSDQHRGWFNTSLVIGVGTRGEEPFRAVVTHGFVVDEKGQKISKRLGNGVDPVEACDQYGADILRLWAASVNYQDDVPIGANILKQVGEQYRTIRNTLRFLLGNLKGYSGETPSQVLDLDEWIVEQTDLLVVDVVDAYRNYDFIKASSAIHNFCTNEISKIYLDAIKDRMYCDGEDWPTRQSGQWACHQVLIKLTLLLAPILVHTAEEVYARIPGIEKRASVHLEEFPAVSEARLASIQASELQRRFAELWSHRAMVFSLFETWKAEAQVKDSQGVVCQIADRPELVALLKSFAEDLPNFYKMSWVELREGEPGASFEISPYHECARSRLRRPDVEQVEYQGETIWLSQRDRRALGIL